MSFILLLADRSAGLPTVLLQHLWLTAVLDTAHPRKHHISQTVLLSDMTRTMLPGPAISTSFSCQLSSTLIA